MGLNRELVSVFLLCLILGFFLILPAEATTSSSKVQQIDIRNEDLVVQGDERYVISNASFEIAGDIIVKDEATLVVRNSTVNILSRYKDQYRINLEGNASIQIQNSRIATSEPTKESVLGLSENSSSRIINSTVEIDVSPRGQSNVLAKSSNFASEFYWMESAQVSIMNSSLSRTMVFAFTGRKNENLSFNGLDHDTMVNSFSLKSIEGGKLQIRNSFVSRWTIYFYKPWTRKNITLENSKSVWIWLTLPEGSDLKISNLHEYTRYARLDLSNRIRGKGLNYNLVLRNSSVDMWKLIPKGGVSGSRYSVTNVSGQISPYGNSNIVVKKSRVRFFIRGGGGNVTFLNSTLRRSFYLIPKVEVMEGVKPTSEIVFENTTVKGVSHTQIASRTVWIRGNASISLSKDSIVWDSGTLKRQYPTKVVETNGSSASKASLKLINPEGNTVWSESLEEEDVTFFTIAFNKSNYKEPWKLVGNFNNRSVSKRIGITTDTPIALSPRTTKEAARIKISHANYLIKWAKAIEKETDIAKAKEMLEKAEKEYEDKNYQKSYLIAGNIVDSIDIDTDGNRKDWQGIQPIATDPKNDAKKNYSDIKGDIKALYAVRTNMNLYIMLETYGKLNPETIAIDFDFDQIGNDYHIHGETSSILESPPYGDYREEYTIERELGNVLELRIPLEKIGRPENIRVKVFTYYPTEESKIDEMPDPVPIPRPSINELNTTTQAPQTTTMMTGTTTASPTEPTETEATSTLTDSPPTTGGTVPGFGIVVTLIAFLAVVILTLRLRR